MNTTKIVSWLTAASVLVIAVISFILSYTALYEVGYSNGVSEDLSYLWPLLIDVPLIVYSLSVVNAYLHSESNWKQWTLVSVYTGLTIFFNILHTGIEFPYSEIVTPVIVAIIAPVSLFFSFEMLMGQLRNGVKRSELYKSIKDLSNRLTVDTNSYNQAISNKEIELQDVIDGYNQTITQLQSEIENYNSIISNKKEELDLIIDGYNQSITDKEDELTRLQQAINSIDMTEVDRRRSEILDHLKSNPDTTANQLAETYNVSVATIYSDFRDLKEKAGLYRNGDGWKVE